jgi:hypothetical protein
MREGEGKGDGARRRDGEAGDDEGDGEGDRDGRLSGEVGGEEEMSSGVIGVSARMV